MKVLMIESASERLVERIGILSLGMQREREMPVLAKEVVILGSMSKVLTCLMEREVTSDGSASGGGRLEP